jgi:hypothetical protein
MIKNTVMSNQRIDNLYPIILSEAEFKEWYKDGMAYDDFICGLKILYALKKDNVFRFIGKYIADFIPDIKHIAFINAEELKKKGYPICVGSVQDSEFYIWTGSNMMVRNHVFDYNASERKFSFRLDNSLFAFIDNIVVFFENTEQNLRDARYELLEIKSTLAEENDDNHNYIGNNYPIDIFLYKDSSYTHINTIDEDLCKYLC